MILVHIKKTFFFFFKWLVFVKKFYFSFSLSIDSIGQCFFFFFLNKNKIGVPLDKLNLLGAFASGGARNVFFGGHIYIYIFFFFFCVYMKCKIVIYNTS